MLVRSASFPQIGVETVVASGWTTTYAIDHFGYRDVRQDALPDTAAPTLLFAGESIAVGTTVPYEQTYGAVVGSRLGLQSVNVAVAGFGNDQAYLFASQALGRKMMLIQRSKGPDGARPIAKEYLARLRDLGRAYREVLGRHFPAMTLVQVVALVEDRAKVEIEATAVIPK